MHSIVRTAALAVLSSASFASAFGKKKSAEPPPPPLPSNAMDAILQGTGQLAGSLEGISDLHLFAGSVALLVGFYVAGAVFLSGKSAAMSRRRSWVITLLSSLVMSVTGVYFAARLYTTEGAILLPDFSGAFTNADNNAAVAGSHQELVDSTMANAICIFFLAYCCTDSLFCLVAYPEQVSVGYTHHAGYAALLVYLLSANLELLFGLCAIEEVPTLILALYEVSGDTRPRLPTGLAIFALRVTYHLFVTYKALELLNTPLFFFSAYLLLHHIAWFRSWFFQRVEAVKEETDFALGSHDAAKKDASTKKGGQSKLKLEVGTHVYLVSALLLAQVAMHLAFVSRELSQLATPVATWGDRSSVVALFLADMAGHSVCFFFVVARMVDIVRDVYTEHFIMHTIEQRSIIYNISWEDPRVERELLNMGKDDVVLTISSAGCNVLDYLVTEPKHIVACDFNQAQLAVLELKLACIEHLEHALFWAIWAESDYGVFQAEYSKPGGLREKLLASKTATCEATVSFWDDNHALIKDNFMFAGSSGLAARLLMPFLRFLGIVAYMEQRKQYPPANISLALFRGFLQSQFMWVWLAPLGGVPESQLGLIKREPFVWSERIEEVLGRRMWSADNYFYFAYVAGRWDPSCCPPYMEQSNFAALKEGARLKKVTLVHGGWADGAQTRRDFTVASLLDSMDWMPDGMIAENIARLYPRMSDGVSNGNKKQGHIFWRSFATKVHSPVLAALRPELVPDDGSERVGWYLSQWAAPVQPHKDVDFSRFVLQDHEALTGKTGSTYSNTPLQDLQVIAAMGVQAMRTEKSTVEFYKSQGDAYDGFRESLLPGRDVLQHYCLPWHRQPKTWVSVGCGTARDVEYVVGHLKKSLTHVYLLDLSPALLDMARRRIHALGLEKQVTLVVADVTAAFNPDGSVNKSAVTYLPVSESAGKGCSLPVKPLPPLGAADLVTCSYCLTMIPAWKGALEVMIAMLKGGGSLSLIDFTKREDCPEHWTQHLNAWWFANDGVYFDHAHTAYLKAHAKLQTVWYHEAEGRVPYTPLHATHYLWTGLKK